MIWKKTFSTTNLRFPIVTVEPSCPASKKSRVALRTEIIISHFPCKRIQIHWLNSQARCWMISEQKSPMFNQNRLFVNEGPIATWIQSTYSAHFASSAMSSSLDFAHCKISKSPSKETLHDRSMNKGSLPVVGDPSDNSCLVNQVKYLLKLSSSTPKRRRSHHAVLIRLHRSIVRLRRVGFEMWGTTKSGK